MALAVTVVLAPAIGLCLLFAWAVHRRGAVGLIAGYDGDLSPEREAELGRDAATVLVVTAAAVGLLVVEAWTGAIPRPVPLVTLTVLTAIAWFLRKWNA
jgi:hypothetical protein